MRETNETPSHACTKHKVETGRDKREKYHLPKTAPLPFLPRVEMPLSHNGPQSISGPCVIRPERKGSPTPTPCTSGLARNCDTDPEIERAQHPIQSRTESAWTTLHNYTIQIQSR